jgi:type I restriction enzyme S subunit
MPLNPVPQARHDFSRLPEGWQWVRLGELIAEAKPGVACGQRDEKGVVQLRMNNVDTPGNFAWDDFIRVPAEAATVEEYRLAPGDLLFNNTNSTELVGKSALFAGFTEPVVYSNHFTRLRVNRELPTAEFLALWLQEQWQAGTFGRICNRWIGQSAGKADKLLFLKVPLPPLPEQRRIVRILMDQLAAVERARKAAEQDLSAIGVLPATILPQAFSGGI